MNATVLAPLDTPSQSSSPGSTRGPSRTGRPLWWRGGLDGRVKPGHDGGGGGSRPRAGTLAPRRVRTGRGPDGGRILSPPLPASLILSASPPRSEIMTSGWGGDSAGWESFRPPWMRIPWSRRQKDRPVMRRRLHCCLDACPSRQRRGQADWFRTMPRPDFVSRHPWKADRIGEALSHHIADHPLRDGASPMLACPGRAGGFFTPERSSSDHRPRAWTQDPTGSAAR